MPGVALFTMTGPDNGAAVRSVPDVTANGVPEVAFGAGSDSNSVYAVDGASGDPPTLLWRYQATDAINSVRVPGDLDGDGALDLVAAVGDADGHVVLALDGDPPSAAGATLWSYPTGSPTVYVVGTLPDVTGDGVAEALAGLWTIDGSAVRCLNGATGALVWASTEVTDYVMLLEPIADGDGDGEAVGVVGRRVRERLGSLRREAGVREPKGISHGAGRDPRALSTTGSGSCGESQSPTRSRELSDDRGRACSGTGPLRVDQGSVRRRRHPPTSSERATDRPRHGRVSLAMRPRSYSRPASQGKRPAGGAGWFLIAAGSSLALFSSVLVTALLPVAEQHLSPDHQIGPQGARSLYLALLLAAVAAIAMGAALLGRDRRMLRGRGSSSDRRRIAGLGGWASIVTSATVVGFLWARDASWLLGEEGALEVLQLLAWLGAAVALGVAAWALHRRSAWLAALQSAGAVLALLVLGEEASWGQHLFGWHTPARWEALNAQGETNLHNLLNERYATLYTVAAVVLLLAWLGGLVIAGWGRRRSRLSWLLPTPSTTVPIAAALLSRILVVVHNDPAWIELMELQVALVALFMGLTNLGRARREGGGGAAVEAHSSPEGGSLGL